MAGLGSLLVDTGFFIALLNERDQYHESARQLEGRLDIMPIMLPWPILYETVNTRLIRRADKLAKFNAIALSPKTMLLDDSPYRERALATVLAQHAYKVSLSLVDAVLCNIIEDVNVPISAMLTFNERDFRPICYQHDIELLNSN